MTAKRNGYSSPVEYEDLPTIEEIDDDVELMAYKNNKYSEEENPLIRSSYSEPVDRKHGVFLIFGFLGLASLLPWNFFITAKKYFDFKFRNTSLPSNVSFDDEKHITSMQKEFESYLSIVSNGSNLFFMIITVLLVRAIVVKYRVLASTLLITIIFIVTSALTEVDTDSWQGNFFIFTLVAATLMSGAQSVLTGSVLGLSAIFPPIYSQSAMIGQAAGGTFSALCSILTHTTGGDPVTSGLIFFLIATVITVLSFVAYIWLHFLSFSRYYMISLANNINRASDDDMPANEGDALNKVNYFKVILRKSWMYCLSVCLVFLVTLSIFPAVCSLIKPMSKQKSEWGDTYFTPVICFLLFNVGDFVGRLITFICKFPGSHRPGLLLLFCFLRMGFVPLLMLCNAQPREHLPVVLDDDAYPIILISLLGLTNGYLGTLCMSFGPLTAEDEHLEGTGIMLALAMTVGLAAGSGFSILFVNLI
ncbi:hypothetical protein Btru_052375 [Bulinus truncatus]|nr:hypothetical protein Btru_052375 [Bulinus truncatus]